MDSELLVGDRSDFVGRRDRFFVSAMGLLLALQIVLPLPGTIALRVFLIVINLGLCGYLFYKRRPVLAHMQTFRLPALLYAALTLWILFGAAFLSIDSVRSFAEFNGQWLRAFMLFAIGALTAMLFATAPRSRRLLLIIALAGLVFHIGYLDLDGLLTFAKTGHVPQRIGGLTDGPDKVNFMTNAFVAFLLAEAYFILFSRAPRLFSRPVFVLLAAMSLFAFYIEAMRNGVACFVLSILVFVLIYVGDKERRSNRLRLALNVLALSAIALSTVYMSAETDHRWGALDATIPIALDTTHNKAWLNQKKFAFPRLPNGQPVNPSNYLRIAWFKEGLKMVGEHPLGIGYDRNAFGHELQRKYHDGSGGGSSHSGLLDMLIATGIPGALLWLAFLLSILKVSLDCFRRTNSYYALALFFVVLDYSSRMVVDGIVRDHIFEQFMLFVGLLSVMTVLDVGVSTTHGVSMGSSITKRVVEDPVSSRT